MAMNIAVLKQRRPDSSSALERYGEIAQILTGNSSASIEDGLRWIHQLCGRLAAPRLRDFGLTERQIPSLIEKAAQASSMKANPIKLTTAELREVALRSL
jgi:alcohol dehydrogenase class IV